jgi:hypothetical protein
MSGLIFDATASYRAAFMNSLGWSLLNLSIVLFLVYCGRLTDRLVTRDAGRLA